MGSQFARRVQKNQLRVPRESLTKLAEATKALSNLDQVRQLNDLLGVVRDMTPYLEETRTVCAMLIEESKGLQRRLARQEFAVQAAFREAPASLGLVYQRALGQWDQENPLEDPPAPNGEGQATEAPQ